MSATVAVRWLRLSAAAVHERREWLTELDAAIGDGDHGINLDRGFGRIVAALDTGELPIDHAGTLLAAAGRLVLATVGGASGALYGRALIRIGERLSAAGAAVESAVLVVPEALDAGVDAIAALGRSRPGEKTMLDALVPAAVALHEACETGTTLSVACRAAAQAADEGAQGTIPMLATKGRASYLGRRSIGHLDPGAASSALLLGTLADAVEADSGTRS